MIVLLDGVIEDKFADEVVLNVSGVGYGLLVPIEDASQLSQGEPAKLYIYEHIRETSHDLYGFLSLDVKALFEQLLGVSGIGPKMALSILGIGTAKEVRTAIAAGDTKFIQAANGVGKRVAERVVVELKDKVGLVPGASADAVFVGSQILQQDEATQALVSLGYSLPDAVNALAGIDHTLSTEERVKKALTTVAL